MIHDRVQKSSSLPQIKKKQSRIIAQPMGIHKKATAVQAKSGIPSKGQREAMKRSIFGSESHSAEAAAPQLELNVQSPESGRGEKSTISHTQTVQPKLTIGEVGDVYEQEADRVAAEVVQRIHSPAPKTGGDGAVQRQEMEESEEEMQKSLGGTLQRVEISQLNLKSEILNRKSEAPADLEASIQRARGSGQPLAQSIREPMEREFGADFSRVRVHTDAKSNEMNQSIQAKAFTTGSDIFFRQGAYEPGSRGGQELLAHELTHVVQQSGGTVQRQLKKQAKIIQPSKKAVFLGTDEQAANQVADKALHKINASESIQRLEVSSYSLANHVNSFTISHTGGEVLQRAYELCQPTDVTHINDHRAMEVRVTNISGSPLGAAANSPTDAGNPFGWQELRAAGHTLANTGSNSSHYNAVRMHLWNGRLGGPGDVFWNLAPGPAKVNSMMSAGPETSAKNLVEAGNSIWLHTKVSYLNNSNNANDFTSVVPNRIDMTWGVMPNTVSGTWGTDIELPVAPLQGTAAQEYQDWAEDKAADLVNKLKQTGITDQIRAQAFDLVQFSELKWAIIQNFPQIYLGMNKEAKGEIIKVMPDTVLDEFMKNGLNVITSPELFVQEIILPLVVVSDVLKAQRLFSELLNRQEQRKAIIAYKWELLQHLGAIAETFVKTDWTIFNYLPYTYKAYLLSSMEETNDINAFLRELTNQRQRKELFDLWANDAGKGGSPQEKFDFIQGKTNLEPDYINEFKTAMDQESSALEYRQNRPTRSTATRSR